jgi:predicted deacylase
MTNQRTSPIIEVFPRDLSAYRHGNVGVDYVHQFKSNVPGPHVLINALTHGNEFCGMVFGRLLELVELWAGLRVKRQFS